MPITTDPNPYGANRKGQPIDAMSGRRVGCSAKVDWARKCTRRATVVNAAGAALCTQHSPAARERRDQKRQEEFEAASAQRVKRTRVLDAKMDVWDQVFAAERMVLPQALQAALNEYDEAKEMEYRR